MCQNFIQGCSIFGEGTDMTLAKQIGADPELLSHQPLREDYWVIPQRVRKVPAVLWAQQLENRDTKETQDWKSLHNVNIEPRDVNQEWLWELLATKVCTVVIGFNGYELTF